MANIQQVLVPDIGDYKEVPVIEVLVKAGDTIKIEQSLLTLETDKATMDVPSPFDGVVQEVRVKTGDKISEGSLILLLESSAPTSTPIPAEVTAPPTPSAATGQSRSISAVQQPAPLLNATSPRAQPVGLREGVIPTGKAHASPSIRRFARELGVDLTRVNGSGPKARVTREDVQSFVKALLTQPGGVATGFKVAEMPQVDFAKFGAIETKPLSRIKKIAGANLHRNWVTIPHVTQFDEADITDMETLRKQLNEQHAAQNIKITPLAFLLKAAAVALREYPEFNASLDAAGENLVLKKYCHIGIAVDTPEGLVVPVLRNVDQKTLVQLAQELGEVSVKAREKKLPATEMQGGCFSISSLGGIGGTSFTPIINAPEVAILGVSRASHKALYQDGKFVPRLMLPLALSYDHRVIDGAAAARFTTFLAKVLADTRQLGM